MADPRLSQLLLAPGGGSAAADPLAGSGGTSTDHTIPTGAAPIGSADHLISLRPAQGLVFNDPARFRILVAGRRFGKTYYACVELAVRAASSPGTYWYMAPTYSQAKDLAWSLLKKVIPAAWVAKKNESDLRLELYNGSVIELKGSENADSLRGRSLTGVVLDEAAVMKRHVWFEVVRPSLADQQGWALFITTPKGTSSWFYEIFLAAGGRLDLVDPDEAVIGAADDWNVHTFTTLQGGNVPPAEVEAARRELDARTFRQEFEASFEALAGIVCVSFSNENISTAVCDDPKLPLWIGLDFNVDPFAAVCAVKKTVTTESVDAWGVPHVTKVEFLHVFDCISLHGNSTTWDMAEAIYQKFGYERKIEVMPDPTGIRLQTSGTGISDHRILRKCGLKVVAPTRPWFVKDKINALNSAFQTGDGTRHAFIHPRCRPLINGLRSWTYDDGKNTPDKKLGNDHFPDALGYLLLAKFNLPAKALRLGDPYRVW
jgi:hypothetical protein